MVIPRQESWKVLLIGDSCEDIYHYGICDRLSPEAPVPVLKQSKIEKKEGMSSNVRLNVESFGVKVEHFHNSEVIRKHRLVDIRYNQHLLRFDEGEGMPLKPFDVGVISDSSQFDAVIISDYDKGFLPNDVMANLCEMFRNKPVFVDSKKRDLSSLFGCFIKINKKEFASLVRAPKDSRFIVTLGESGALYDKKIYSTDRTEVFDVCGAGDVFLSALVCGWLQYGDMSSAIKLANKCASISVSKMGTYVLTEGDLNDICI